MCGTARNGSADTCSYCGYIYEDSMESSSPLSFNQNLSSEISPESETFTSPASAELSVASSNESVLRRQDNVIFRNNRSIQEGVLVLTTKRLVFASGKSIKGDGGVQDILQDRSAYAIPLEQIQTCPATEVS